MRQSRKWNHLAGLAMAGLLAACATEQPASPEAPSVPVADGESDVLPFAAVHGAANLSLKPCSAAAYRQFDFWLGQWDITEAGAPAGTNVVEPLLGGCAIRENYLDPDGGSVGTSLNSYDADTRQWRQTWVADYRRRLPAGGRPRCIGHDGADGRADQRARMAGSCSTRGNGRRSDASTMLQTGRLTVPAIGLRQPVLEWGVPPRGRGEPAADGVLGAVRRIAVHRRRLPRRLVEREGTAGREPRPRARSRRR